MVPVVNQGSVSSVPQRWGKTGALFEANKSLRSDHLHGIQSKPGRTDSQMVFEVFYQNKYFHNTDHSCIIGDSFVLSPQCLKYPMALKYTMFYLLLTENSTIFLELLYLFIPHWKVLLNIKLILLTILKLQYAFI